MKFTVAIDGPAAAGKGTISKAIAEVFGFGHLDSGLLYRAVGIKTLEHGNGILDPVAAEDIAKHLTPEDLRRDDLRTGLAARAASKVAVLPNVRGALLEFQRIFARRDGGAVIDGRDIGTVICPEAEVKLFVTASAEIRARRRFEELKQTNADLTLDSVLNDVRARDKRDSEREMSPMVPAEDAVLLDTSELSIDAAVAKAVAIINERLEQGRD